MTLHTSKRVGFKSSAMHKKKEPHAFHYLSQRASFWIAVVSVFAFVTGNMIGQHGFYAFLHSVMGEFDDSLIVYDGAVPPVAKVADLTRWSYYGGDATRHTFREVPQDVLISLPHYVPATERDPKDLVSARIYAVDYGAGYADGTDGHGSHLAEDIIMPEGTPIQSVMNAMVVKVGEDSGGFGKFILLKHPRVPDPENPKKSITLYSLYAHLSSQLVSEGETVRKGELIGASGMTGNASGPHLHFQMQRDICTDGTMLGSKVFWPFTGADQRAAGLSFSQAINQGLKRGYGISCTVNGMAYVQANYTALEKPLIVASADAKASASSSRTKAAALTRDQRIAARKSKVTTVAMASSSSETRVALKEPTSQSNAASASSAASSTQPPAVVSTVTVAYATPVIQTPQTVDTISIRLDDTFQNRQWKRLIITLLDKNGDSIESPVLEHDLTFRTAYGRAEFKPQTLTSLDFNNGKATVQMLPTGAQTVVVQIQPWNILSAPMKFIDAK